MRNPQPTSRAETKALIRWLSRTAEVCRSTGQYGEAEPLYRKALVAAETTFGPNHLETAGVLNDLGVLYKYMGRFTEAGQFYRKALEIMEQVLEPNHTALATLIP